MIRGGAPPLHAQNFGVPPPMPALKNRFGPTELIRSALLEKWETRVVPSAVPSDVHRPRFALLNEIASFSPPITRISSTLPDATVVTNRGVAGVVASSILHNSVPVSSL